MQYSFEKLKETFPKTSSRSKRTLKKMHLGEFAETVVLIDFPTATFGTPFEWELLDAMYEHDSGICVGGNSKSTHMLVQIKTSEFSEEYIKKYCEDLLFALSNIEPHFAEIEHITVQYGDAYYGEW